MKVSSIVALLALAACHTPAVWAQDWDVTPEAQAKVVAIESNAAPMTNAQTQLTLTEADQILQWDLAELKAQNANLGNTTQLTGQGYYPISSNPTGTQRLPTLAPTTTAVFGNAGRTSGLPSTSLDSFVHDAGGNADQIYGDEGSFDIPPLFSFQTINSGIQSAGLTTGHKSGLPSSWY